MLLLLDQDVYCRNHVGRVMVLGGGEREGTSKPHFDIVSRVTIEAYLLHYIC